MLATIRHDIPIHSVSAHGVKYSPEIKRPFTWSAFYANANQKRREERKLKELYRKSIETERE